MKEQDPLTYSIIGAVFEVKRKAGPGLFEIAYERCLEKELTKRGHVVERQKELMLSYDGELIAAYRCDLVVDDAVIVEVKCVEQLVEEHKSQLLNYIHLAKLDRGLLVNFKATNMLKGIRRVSTKRHIIDSLLRHEREEILEDFGEA